MKTRPAIPLPELRRVLILKPSSLGDVATALPMLCDLKRAAPQAEIDWLIHPGLVDLLHGHAAIHSLIPFDRKRLSAWWYKPDAFGRLQTLLGQIRGPKYDLVIDAQGLFRSGFFSLISGAGLRIGFSSAREGAAWAYTHPVKLPEHPQVAVVRMRALLTPLGIDTTGLAEYNLPLQPEAAARVESLLDDLPEYVAVIPGARWDTKRWSPEGFGEIVRRLQAMGRDVVLLGSPDEAPVCDQVAAAAGGAVRSLAGKTNLAEMIAVLAQAELVLGNDSGPLHVAVALGRKTVSIYGPTDPNFVGPFGQMENVVRHDVECHPCRNRECDHHSCMKGVDVEQVWQVTLHATEGT